ncbi:hypothetical protein QBC43DRAFT_118760 [Cladorrhinum sp. PSN259]|nr:hypothetical protein QBC43DRAFT_118760 [Cladorrhinum sp. PSN259]
MTRQVDIGHQILKNTPDDEKHRLKAPMSTEGFLPRFQTPQVGGAAIAAACFTFAFPTTRLSSIHCLIRVPCCEKLGSVGWPWRISLSR